MLSIKFIFSNRFSASGAYVLGQIRVFYIFFMLTFAVFHVFDYSQNFDLKATLLLGFTVVLVYYFVFLVAPITFILLAVFRIGFYNKFIQMLSSFAPAFAVLCLIVWESISKNEFGKGQLKCLLDHSDAPFILSIILLSTVLALYSFWFSAFQHKAMAPAI
jgi:hypothetical protein